MLFTKNNEISYTLDLAANKANYERKEKALKLLDFYHDQQLAYLYDRLSQNFTDPDRFSLASINITKKIIDGLSTVYISDAKRIIEGTKKDQDLFSQIENDCCLGLKMKQANRFSKLCGTVLLKVVFRRGKIALDVLTPDICDTETGESPEDLKSVTIVYFPESGKQQEVEYSKWTPERIYRLDYRGNEISSVPNPYESLPFIPIWDSLPISDFWVEKGDSLISIQEAVNEKLTDLVYILRLQGFSVPVSKGGGSNFTMLDPGSGLNIPADGDFFFASPNSPIKATLESIDFLIKTTAISYGLPASYLSNKPSERKSGVSRLIENKELQEKRLDDIALFRKYETQVFEAIKTVWNTHQTPKFGDSTLKVNFFDPESGGSENKSDFWGKMVELGVMSPIDIIMKIDPDLSRDEAEQKYKNNIAFKGVNFGDSNND
jgi:hypothetical protein